MTGTEKQTKISSVDILAFAPHPDDVEICCGGLLLKLALSGKKTALIDLTRGELSSQGDLATRAAETQAASKALGLSYRENLALPDGGIGGVFAAEGALSGHEQLLKVVRCICQLRPEVILFPYSAARHPDHVSTSELVERAIFFAGLKNFDSESGLDIHRPKQALMYQMRFAFRPSFVVDISAVHERKMEAIRCYQSQLAIHNPNPEMGTLVGSPLMLKAVEAKDRYYGAMIGVEFGEPFYMQNVISIEDPVEYFRKHPSTQTHVFP